MVIGLHNCAHLISVVKNDVNQYVVYYIFWRWTVAGWSHGRWRISHAIWGFKWLPFPTIPLSPRIWKHATTTRWLANPNQSRRNVPRNSWSSYEYLIHYQSEELLKCSYRSSQLCWLLCLEWLSHLEHAMQLSLLNTWCLFGVRSWSHADQTTCHLNEGVLLRK